MVHPARQIIHPKKREAESNTKNGVERIRAQGQLFDPRLHEAAAAVPSPGTPEGTILEVIRPGFTRQGRLLRPATVVVAQ
jgi:molecular chaperone GrpE